MAERNNMQMCISCMPYVYAFYVSFICMTYIYMPEECVASFSLFFFAPDTT